MVTTILESPYPRCSHTRSFTPVISPRAAAPAPPREHVVPPHAAPRPADPADLARAGPRDAGGRALAARRGGDHAQRRRAPRAAQDGARPGRASARAARALRHQRALGLQVLLLRPRDAADRNERVRLRRHDERRALRRVGAAPHPLVCAHCRHNSAPPTPTHHPSCRPARVHQRGCKTWKRSLLARPASEEESRALGSAPPIIAAPLFPLPSASNATARPAHSLSLPFPRRRARAGASRAPSASTGSACATRRCSRARSGSSRAAASCSRRRARCSCFRSSRSRRWRTGCSRSLHALLRRVCGCPDGVPAHSSPLSI